MRTFLTSFFFEIPGRSVSADLSAFMFGCGECQVHADWSVVAAYKFKEVDSNVEVFRSYQ